MEISASDKNKNNRLQLTTSNLGTLADRLRTGELTLLAGRPGTGNSTISMHLGLEWGLRQRRPVHVYSNQSGLDHWVCRLARMAANLDSHQCSKGRLSTQAQAALKNSANALDQAPITLHREVFMPPESLHTHIGDTVPKGQAGTLILIDYLQWNGRDHHKHAEQVTETLVDLKRMAQTLQASVVLLANLHRAVEMRCNKRPQLRDLPKSYLKTQALDQVWLLYRHGLYVKDSQVPANHVDLFFHQLRTLEKAEFGLSVVF